MRRALGRGLSQLVGEPVGSGPVEVAVESIVPNARQPRTHFDETALSELADSIRQVGILQPLVVRPLSNGTYELIAGERRLRAAKLAGLARVPVLVRSAGQQDSLELALIENVQREDISAMECARAYRRLIDEFALTQEQVADKVGKSRAAVANLVRLLKLPVVIQKGLEEGKISEGHARALLQVEDEALQLALYERILKKGMTVREVESAAKTSTPKPKKPKAAAVPEPTTYGPLEEGLSEFFGASVKVMPGEVGGKLVIDFYSEDDLERILEILGIRL